MDVTQTQPLGTTPANLLADQDVATEPQSGTALSSDFQTFLQMLTTQMENQDPLNPIESADFAVQLATFSSVEQQVMTNDLLNSLTSAMTSSGLGALGQWVGMEVRGSSKASFDGAQIDLYAGANAEADRRQLVVRNSEGQTTARIDLDLSSTDVSWDGMTSGGFTAPEGVYDFKIEAYKGGALIGSEDAQTYSLVTEARIENGATSLILEGGVIQNSDGVTGIRQPVEG